MDRSVSISVWSLNKLAKAGLILFLFLTSCTQLVSFQLDKALMTLFVGVLLFHSFFLEKKVPTNSFFVLIVSLGLILFSYLLNLPESSLIIFFPVIGLAYVTLIGEEESFLNLIYWALFIHISLGIFFVISSYIFGMNSFVHPMYDKGLPFLHAAKGFTTTVQTFGTLIIGWFLIYYWKKDDSKAGFVDQLAYIIVLLGLVLTFNRNSLLIYYIILFFKHKRIFWLSVIAGLAFVVYFFEFINKLIFNLNTLTSRSDLLEAFRIAFFEQTDWLGYLIGHGNNMVDESIARGTYYRTGYIENGTSVLLYTYGFVGYFFYLVSVFVFSFLFWMKEKFFYAAMLFYIFIVAQQFTHEFYSTTIYILLSVFILIFNSYPRIEKKAHLLSPVE
ncbi:hypothetical protein SAMN03080598_00102 [Algoriphagus boritolerans DSM 17298 = JCM 18970]|uniref:O-antigen ligase like membrane protein n=1 Tax=Algoriphagus boritolerans DSM 17298 = JCM 18970 TaxID=1120964 RepID=A0A1H5RT60_9BACT|nr:hypothetical protein SAMN03080598_00102 [Algoriphagus boritolerans DSM 17298 = JCM 18970]